MRTSLKSVQKVFAALFLGAFAELLKVTISFVMSVRPFVSMEHFGSHWMAFHEILYLSFL